MPSSAQWRLEGGGWNASGTMLTNLALGNHTVEYSQVAGFVTLPSETINLLSGTNPTLNRNYTASSLSSLRISLNPSAAQWRIDGGAWNPSGATIGNLALGTHAIDYSSVTGYATPPSERVTLIDGPTTALNRTYTATSFAASLALTLTPSSAQWRIDGRPWTPSGATIGNLALGAHTIDFAPVAGFATPQSETVILNSGVNPPLTRNYTREVILSKAVMD